MSLFECDETVGNLNCVMVTDKCPVETCRRGRDSTSQELHIRSLEAMAVLPSILGY